MSELLALGVSHKTAPVRVRERLALGEHAAREFALAAKAHEDIAEAVAISSCNRTEVYVVVADPVSAEATVLGMLAQRASIRPTQLAEIIYSPRNCDAARQLFRVTAGLESMILGEAEVQGQVRRAHAAAQDAGATGPLLDRLFAAALATGRRVRSRTAIGESHASVPSVAVGLAREVVGDLAERHVVIIGAGETSELTARALANQGVRTIFVANRHAARALHLAQRFSGRVVSLHDLPEQLAAADIVVSSTASPHVIVGQEELEIVMEQRGGRPLLMIDIAVPRDIDPACGEVAGVTLYDIDDLQAVIARNLNSRADQLPAADAIVEEEIRRFAHWLGQADSRPLVAALRARADEVVAQVLAENAGRWESLSGRDRARVEAMAHAVAGRLLHEPTIRLRDLGQERRHSMLELVRELFALDQDGAGAAAVQASAAAASAAAASGAGASAAAASGAGASAGGVTDNVRTLPQRAAPVGKRG